MKNKKLLLSISISAAIFVFVFAIDILTKHIMFRLLPSKGSSMRFIPGFINFIHVENAGVAWGMLAGRPVLLIILALAILALYLAFYIIKLKRNNDKPSTILAISVGLLTGGCLGNLFDRIIFGYVRDFINFEFINFPVFNFADAMICISVVLMFVYFIFIYPKEEEKLKIKQKSIKNDEKNQKNDENIANIQDIHDILIENNNKLQGKRDI